MWDNCFGGSLIQEAIIEINDIFKQSYYFKISYKLSNETKKEYQLAPYIYFREQKIDNSFIDISHYIIYKYLIDENPLIKRKKLHIIINILQKSPKERMLLKKKRMLLKKKRIWRHQKSWKRPKTNNGNISYKTCNRLENRKIRPRIFKRYG
jgi:hypothetical protein